MCKVHEAARDTSKVQATNKSRNTITALNSNRTKTVTSYGCKRKVGLIPKLQTNWDGPYRIITSISDLGYRVQKSLNYKPRVVHYNRLKPFHGETDV